MNEAVSFGFWLKRYRKARDLTQEELAQRVGCSVVSIRKIEADEQRPSRQLAGLLATQLGIPPEEHVPFIQFARFGLDADLPPPLPPARAIPPPHSSPPVPDSLQVVPTAQSDQSADGTLEGTEHGFTGIRALEQAPLLAERNRRRMIAKVKAFWVTGVLEHSLHGAALITLGMADAADAVAHPWEMLVQQPDRPARPLAAGKRIIEVFDDLDGDLLILGTPGAGKTTMLLELARELLARAEANAAYPLPVVFNLASWAAQRLLLTDWMIGELNERYDVPMKIGQEWIAADRIIPLLDGLDEVTREHRTACVEAINIFRSTHGLNHLVVCSRVADYETLAARLKLQGAILVQPLTPAQIDVYMTSAGTHLIALRSALARDQVFQELAQSPLMLSIMTLAYQGVTIDTPLSSTIDERRKQLFAAYVDRMLQRRGANTRYSRQQTIAWLAWLARGLAAHTQTVFFMEQLAPDWLPGRTQRRSYTRWVGLTLGVLYGVMVVLAVGLTSWGTFGRVLGFASGMRDGWILGVLDGATSGIIMGLLVGLMGWTTARHPEVREAPIWSIRTGLVYGLLIGLGVGLVSSALIAWTPGAAVTRSTAIYAGILNGIAVGLSLSRGTPIRHIRTVESLGWSRRKAQIGIAGKCAVGLLAGLAVGGAGVPYIGRIFGLYVGVAVALPTMLLIILSTGLTVRDIDPTAAPNQGIRRSAQNALRVGGTVGLLTFVALGLVVLLLSQLAPLGFDMSTPLGWWDMLSLDIEFAFSFALPSAVLAGLIYGGLAIVQHAVVRWMLIRAGVIPWAYVRFLDDCAERIYLRKVGGGYIFVHRLLQDYFADLDLPQPWFAQDRRG